jgi:beta-phosphoglucomutase
VIRAIFFDFDGVLVDSEPLHWETWSCVLKPKGIEISFQDYCRRFIGVSNRTMIRELCRDVGLSFDPEQFQVWYAEKRALYAQRDLRVPDNLAHFIREDLNGYRLGVVSSSRRSEVEPYLVQSGVRERIDVLVCAEDSAELKPSPQPYIRAAHLAGLPACECLAVEDSDAGQESATGAGMQVARVRGPEEVVDALRRLNCFGLPGRLFREA